MDKIFSNALPHWFSPTLWWCLLVFHPGASHGTPSPFKKTNNETVNGKESFSSPSSRPGTGTEDSEIYLSKRTGAIPRAVAIKLMIKRNLMVLLCLKWNLLPVLCLSLYLEAQLISSWGFVARTVLPPCTFSLGERREDTNTKCPVHLTFILENARFTGIGQKQIN